MKVVRWNIDKPHRCPACHAIVVHYPDSPSRWRVYECCRCATRFAGRPWLGWLLPVRGCNSEEHAGESAEAGCG